MIPSPPPPAPLPPYVPERTRAQLHVPLHLQFDSEVHTFQRACKVTETASAWPSTLPKHKNKDGRRASQIFAIGKQVRSNKRVQQTHPFITRRTCSLLVSWNYTCTKSHEECTRDVSLHAKRNKPDDYGHPNDTGKSQMQS